MYLEFYFINRRKVDTAILFSNIDKPTTNYLLRAQCISIIMDTLGRRVMDAQGVKFHLKMFITPLQDRTGLCDIGSICSPEECIFREDSMKNHVG